LNAETLRWHAAFAEARGLMERGERQSLAQAYERLTLSGATRLVGNVRCRLAASSHELPVLLAEVPDSRMRCKPV
jgi:hypothetical protein